MRKNADNCDGNFCDTEFDSLEAKKQEFRQKASAKRADVGAIAAAIASASAALARAQEEQKEYEREVERLTEQQSAMLLSELQALDALDREDPAGPPIAFSTDELLSWGGPNDFPDQIFGGTPEQAQR